MVAAPSPCNLYVCRTVGFAHRLQAQARGVGATYYQSALTYYPFTIELYTTGRRGASSEQKNSFLSPWPRLISSSEAFLGLSFLELSFPELSFLISSAEDEEEDCLSCRYVGALSRDCLPPR